MTNDRMTKEDGRTSDSYIPSPPPSPGGRGRTVLGILNHLGAQGTYLPLPPGEGGGEGASFVKWRTSALFSSFGHSSLIRHSGFVTRHSPRVLLLLALLLPGCVADLGQGGSGELVVPRERMRAVEPATMEDFEAAAPGGPKRPPPTTLPTTLPAALAGQREVPLTIEDARRLALENNLDLRVELFSPAVAREQVSEEEARWDLLFNTTASYNKTDQPSATRLESNQANDLRVTPGVELPLVTGGTLRADLPLGRFESDNEFSLLNPAHTSDFVVSLSQPLLRGGGVYVSTQPLRIAFYNYQTAQVRTKLEVIRVLTVLDRVYWRLYAARQEARLRRQEDEPPAAR